MFLQGLNHRLVLNFKNEVYFSISLYHFESQTTNIVTFLKITSRWSILKVTVGNLNWWEHVLSFCDKKLLFLLYLSSHLKTFHLLLGQLPMKPFRVLQEVFLPLVHISDDEVLHFFFPNFHVNKWNNVKNEFQGFFCSSKISVNCVGNIQSHIQIFKQQGIFLIFGTLQLLFKWPVFYLAFQ